MNVFKSLPSTLLLLTVFSLGFSFSALACEDEPQAGAGIKVTTPSSQDKEEISKTIAAQLKKAGVTVRDNSNDFALLVEFPHTVQAYIALRHEELWCASYTRHLKAVESVEGPYSPKYFEALEEWGKEHKALIKKANTFQYLLDFPKKPENTESKRTEEHKGEKS